MLKFKAIVPKGSLRPENAQREITAYLRAFADEVKEEMAVYPPERPWQSRTPRSGPRAGGARTGDYGDGWRNAEVKLNQASVSVFNTVSYATVVGGSTTRSPGQAHRLAERGWRSISDVGPEVARHNLPRFHLRIWS